MIIVVSACVTSLVMTELAHKYSAPNLWVGVSCYHMHVTLWGWKGTQDALSKASIKQHLLLPFPCGLSKIITGVILTQLLLAAHKDKEIRLIPRGQLLR